jgi:energy-coupling factor transport system ATP-binding protein
VIRLEEVCVERDGRLLLDRVSLDFAAGRHWVIWGDNGAGKTTLARVLAGLTRVDRGAVIRQEALDPPLPLLFQDPDAQMAAASVRDEVALGCRRPDEPRIRRDQPGPAAERLSAALAEFQLTALASRNPHSLSGGEKRRLNLAALDVLESPVLILDEPELHLDEPSWRAWVELLGRRFHDDSRLLVEISREAGRVLQADRLAVLHEGRVLAAGEPEAVYRELRARDDAPRLPRVAAWEPGGSVPAASPPAIAGDAQVLLRAEALRLKHPARAARLLDDLSLQLRRGERLLILGENGSGKTSLLLLLADLADPDGGRVRLRAPLRSCLALQEPEHACFAETVAEEVALGPKRAGLRGAALAERVDGVLGAMGLSPDELRDRDPFSLSAGELRRVALAAVLALEPAVLILDEPEAALDPTGKEQLRRALEHWTGGLLWADCRPPAGCEGWFHRRLRLEEGRLVELHA